MCFFKRWCDVLSFANACVISYAGTIEYEAELRHKNEIARLEMEIKGKLVT